ncbi:MAG: long-chain-fatty-acid--CoA ligase [Ardenticatenaceae bacterium]|nr:long-chain-fatty-acid--CoA ligase [Ardenticatenaceae bacterium]
MYITHTLTHAVLVNRKGTATIDGERQRTWAQFAERVAKLAGGLRSLGLQPDDRVAVLALNSDRYLELFFAVQWAGGIILPLNTRLAVPELVYMLQDAEAAILVVDDNFVEIAPELREQTAVHHLILASDSQPAAGLLGYEDLLATAVPLPDTERGNDDIAAILYTGGTTGLPKGVMLTHRNLISNALAAIANMPDPQPWVYLHSAPMFHIADCQWNVGITMLAATHVFMPRFVPEQLLTTIEQYHVTHCALVPTMINMIYNVAHRVQADTRSLRRLNYGGSPMPPAIITKARDIFPNCKFIQGYGQTETSPNISMLGDEYHVMTGPKAGKIESAGRPILTMAVKIVDAMDKELPLGEIGEIVVKGPNVMAGYWHKVAETAVALRGGWMHTGDAGYLDEDGFLFIVDRVKDMIITGGENVYSAEVENVIYQYPGVALCAVIGIPDEQWGEAVHAVVVPKEGVEITAVALLQHCRTHIAGYKCPRSVDIRTDPLPMSGAGKILKRELRKPFWEGHTRQVS